MSFRCFKSKTQLYSIARNDNNNREKSKTKNSFPLDDKSGLCSLKNSIIKEDEIIESFVEFPRQIHRSSSDLSLFRLPDNCQRVSWCSDEQVGFINNISQVSGCNSMQSWSGGNSGYNVESNCSMEHLVDIWSRNSTLTSSNDDSQRFISNLMSKKAFDVVKEPLRSLPREMSVKYSKDPTAYFVNNEAVSKDRSSQNNYYIKKPHTSLKGLPPEKSFNDSIATISSGPLAIVRGVENRNSGGSSSVATPNSPQQSPLSLCSSSGGKSSDNQLYEDGLSEEELRQIAIRQQRQIQLQIDDLRQKQQQINHLKQQIEKKSKSPKVNQSILKLKDVYDQQEQKISSLRSSKNQVAQNRNNCATLKTDIGNFQNIMSTKKHELKKLESRNEELREYIQFVHQRCNSSGSVPPDFETFIRQKHSSIVNVHKSNTVHVSDQTSHCYQSRVLDPQIHTALSPGTYPEHSRMYVRHAHTSDNYSNPHFPYNNVAEVSAFVSPSSGYRSKPPESAGTSRPPPLPAHSYQRSAVHISEKSLSQSYIDSNIPSHQSKDKRPPLPSYSDATVISANNKISMLLSQASRSNAHTPTSSPPVLRRSSIVGLPYGKMPSRFASRNTINNVYIKKSSQESLEKYKKTASEMYKAQLSKFKSSSTDDVRADTNENVTNATETIVSERLIEDISQEEQLPDPPAVEMMVTESIENGSICSSCSSLSLPEDLKEDASAHVLVAEESSATVVTVAVSEKTLDNSTMTIEVEDFDCLLWDKSIKRALEALTREPEKKILKKVTSTPSHSVNKRKAYFHPHSLLLDAALEAEFDLVKDMASKVEDISEATDEGITALHNAVCSGREDIVKFLLDLGAHVNAGDTDGWTPLHCAASCNNVTMARLLVEYGASLFATSISDSEIPLQKCEADDDTECEQYLFAQQDILGVSNDGKVYSLFHYEPKNQDELPLYLNQEIKIIDREPASENGWFFAVDLNGSKKEGFVPKAYVSSYQLTLPQKVVEPQSSESVLIQS